MPIHYRIDHAARIIEETWVGTVTINDLSDYWRIYLADTDVLSLRRTVVDLRDADIAFNGLELQDLVETLVLPILGGRDWKTAIIVHDPVQFGVARQYNVFADRYSRDSIFDNPDEARMWLSATT
jgi:hypothetical protein